MPQETATDVALTIRESGASVARAADIMGTEQFDKVWRMSKALAASGMFKDVKQAEQAFGRILIGQDLGLSPTQALMSIDVVRGNVQLRGKLLLSWVRQSDGYDYEVIERTPERGAIRFFEKNKRSGEWQTCGPDITFSLAEAKDAGLVKAESAWSNWPANMCLWRCASIGVNLYCPDLLGGVPVYTEADSFSNAPTVGHGDGTAPEWEPGDNADLVDTVETLMGRAEQLGDRAASDVTSVRMRLNLQPRVVWLAWIADTTTRLQDIAAAGEAGTVVSDAEVVEEGQDTGEPVNGPEAGQGEPVAVPTLTFGGETFTFNDTDDPYAMLSAVLDGKDPAVMLDTAKDMRAMADSVDSHPEGDPEDAAWIRSMAVALDLEAMAVATEREAAS